MLSLLASSLLATLKSSHWLHRLSVDADRIETGCSLFAAEKTDASSTHTHQCWEPSARSEVVKMPREKHDAALPVLGDMQIREICFERYAHIMYSSYRASSMMLTEKPKIPRFPVKVSRKK